MPIPSSISGTPVMGWNNAVPIPAFYVGYTGSGSYIVSAPAWSMVETPAFNTLEQKTQGARSVRNPMYANPVHSWKLKIAYFSNNPALIRYGNVDTDLRTFYSWWLSLKGKYADFLYQPMASVIVNTPLAAPDANGYVELVYNNGPFFSESVQELNNVTPSIYRVSGGVYTDITSYCSFYTADSVSPYSGITFTIEEGHGPSGEETLAWSGVWYYRCHFLKDAMSFEEFFRLMYSTGIDIEQVKI